MEYPKIHHARAWLVQAYVEPGSNILLRGMWIGVLEDVKAVSGHLGQYKVLPLADALDTELRLGTGGYRFFTKRIPGSPYVMGGAFMANEQNNILVGSEQSLSELAFPVLSRLSPLPVLRCWSSILCQALIESRHILKLDTFGEELDVFHVRIPDLDVWQEILIANLSELRAAADKQERAEAV